MINDNFRVAPNTDDDIVFLVKKIGDKERDFGLSLENQKTLLKWFMKNRPQLISNILQSNISKVCVKHCEENIIIPEKFDEISIIDKKRKDKIVIKIYDDSAGQEAKIYSGKNPKVAIPLMPHGLSILF
jgi:hypothetical protein